MIDVERCLFRSLTRVVERMPDDSPFIHEGDVICPWCQAPLDVRRSKLGRLDEVDGRRPYIEGVALKCAGEGCGFRPDFDVPLRAGWGVWPDLSGKAEWERERELRDGEVLVDAGYTPDEGKTAEERLIELGYLDAN